MRHLCLEAQTALTQARASATDDTDEKNYMDDAHGPNPGCLLIKGRTPPTSFLSIDTSAMGRLATTIRAQISAYRGMSCVAQL